MPDMQTSLLRGSAIHDVIDELAAVRIAVFREWPYLYDGDLEYEREYLKAYSSCERSACIVVRDQNELVGMSTLMPLADEHEDFREPMRAAGYDVERIFYFGESCLLPAYRGRGLYQEFFKRREQHVCSFGSDYHGICFCAVERPADHPMKPDSNKSLDSIWPRFGFKKIQDLYMQFSWRDVGDAAETRKRLAVWYKSIGDKP